MKTHKTVRQSEFLKIGDDWRQSLLERCDSKVLFHTPTGLLRGVKAAARFLRDLNDLLYEAKVTVTNIVEKRGRLYFRWRAAGPLSEVHNGRGWMIIRNGRIVEKRLSCKIEPLVMNHG